MTWQPIETAPMDGTEIVLLGTIPGDERLRTCISRHTLNDPDLGGQDGWRYGVPGYTDAFLPTHWMPLPEALHLTPCKVCGSSDIALMDHGYTSFNVGGGKCNGCGRTVTVDHLSYNPSLDELTAIWNAGQELTEEEQLRAENAQLRGALEALHAEQNGPPLVRRAEQWQVAMDAAEQLINRR